ncbi:hypothetical protein COS69_00860, partial [Candidatus Kaiserbacteria bacterium CG06_land_8_20_14_3_00_49_31]
REHQKGNSKRLWFAERSEANPSNLRFPTWCSILELVRTHLDAAGGWEFHPRAKIRKGSGAAPLKTAQEPGEKHRLEPLIKKLNL